MNESATPFRRTISIACCELGQPGERRAPITCRASSSGSCRNWPTHRRSESCPSRKRLARAQPGWGQVLRSRPAWFLVAAASVLLMLTARFWLGGDRAQKPRVGETSGLVGKNTTGRPTGDSPVPADNGSASAGNESVVSTAGGVSLPKEQLLAKAQLFAEMQAVFGSQLQWLAETTDRVELGLGRDTDASSQSSAGDHVPLMVQVVVERRAAGSADWKTVWTTDVVALDQEPVTWRAAEGTPLPPCRCGPTACQTAWCLSRAT